MRKPNFFIIGAPKCGTTTIGHTLGAHPQVFVPRLLEPNFFSTDVQRVTGFERDLDWYMQLFAGADETYAAVGEKSVSYLYSEEAIRNILAFNDNAQLIVCLRNPVEMAPSYHAEQVFQLTEDVRDFEMAWRLQDARLAGEHLPSFNPYPSTLQYRTMCRLGQHVQALYRLIERERVHLVFMDDIKENFDTVYRSLLSFLNVPYAQPPERRRYRRYRQHRSYTLAHMLNPKSHTTGAKVLRRLLRLTGPLERPLTYRLDSINTRQGTRKALNAALRDELRAEFREDVALLADLTQRDLSHWC